MKFRSLGVVGLLLSALGACVTTTPIAGQTIDRTYTLDGFRWESGATVYVMLKTFKSGNKVGLCGAWSARGGSSIISQFHTDVLDAGSVVLGGTTIRRGLLFMKEHGGTGELVGKASNCIESSVDWQPEYGSIEPNAVFPRMTFNI